MIFSPKEGYEKTNEKVFNKELAALRLILYLNHQRKIEILKSQPKLEQASVGKFEMMFKDTRIQSEKFAEQISVLSREALASASSSAMVVKLKDIISQVAPTAGQVKNG